MQGQCESEGAPALGASQAPRKPGQCVITLQRRSFLLWWFNTHPFCLHNLYFRASTRVAEFAAHTAPVLLSHVTIQRTGEATPFDEEENTALLLLRMPSVLLQGAPALHSAELPLPARCLLPELSRPLLLSSHLL